MIADTRFEGSRGVGA